MFGRRVLVACLLSLFVALASSEQCETARSDLEKNGRFHPDGDDLLECIDPCDSTGYVFANQSECEVQGYCHWNGSGCFLKTILGGGKNDSKNSDQSVANMLRKMLEANDTTGTANNTTGVEGKVLGIGQPNFPFPFFLPPGCIKFPATCSIDPFDPNILDLIEPPVNIPYCQRTPCSISNPFLEFDRFGCHSKPGCYFDVELAHLRFTFGHAIMPAVPVCHMAVRNRAFQKLASDFMKTNNNQWNGLLTNCFIEENKKSILEPSHGCYMIDVLEYMEVKPKQAGWEGITEQECYLIDGCYNPSHGCFYGAAPRKVQVRSGKDEYRSAIPTPREIYGQPKCGPFVKDSKPADYLNYYHSCMQSGCVADQAVLPLVKEKLLSLTLLHVPPKLRLAYWFMVETNLVGPDNWKSKADELKRNPIAFTNVFRQSIWIDFKRIVAHLLNKDFDSRRFPTAIQTPESVFSHLNDYEKRMLLNPELAFIESGQRRSPNFPIASDLASKANASALSLFPLELPCPFRNFHLEGFPSLKGSFSGCCETNPCYMSRTSIFSQASGVAAYWAQWEPWSGCSKTCGGGIKIKRHRCVKFKEQDDCGEEKEIHMLCNDEKCPEWTSWSNWESCTASCGGGRAIRRRACDGSGCKGKYRESKPCMTEICPIMGPWTRWLACNASCSTGVQTRGRTCNDSATSIKCPEVSELLQTRKCDDYCGRVVAMKRSKCTGFPDCAITTTYECKTQRGESKAHCKPFKPKRRRRCTKSNFRCRWCRFFQCKSVDN